jgi:hypothetical protein
MDFSHTCYPKYEIHWDADSPFHHKYWDEDGIHYIVFNEPTRLAVRLCFDLFTHIYRTYPEGEQIRVLCDVTNGIPPLAFMMRYTREKFQGITIPPLRIAYLMPSSVGPAMIQSFLEVVKLRVNDKANRGFFQPGQTEEAREWLLTVRK